MAQCSVCGENSSMPFTCKFCERSFCSRHRLPENHDCTGLEEYRKQSREEGKIGYDIVKEEPASEPAAQPLQRRLTRTADRYLSQLPVDATFVLLGVMFAVYLLGGTVPGFFERFALTPGLVLREPWRIVTSMFLHANLGHLLVNSIVLFSFGTTTERMLGTRKFLEVLFVAGIASSIGFTLSGFLFGMGSAVGFSGALYGMVALLAVIRPDIRVLALFFIPLKIRTAIIAFGTMDLINFTAHAMGIFLPVIGGFASAGHLSGLAAGLAFGYLWKDRYGARMPGPLWSTQVARI